MLSGTIFFMLIIPYVWVSNYAYTYYGGVGAGKEGGRNGTLCIPIEFLN